MVRHRARLPDGVANYVSPRGMRLLREQVAAAEGAHRADLERGLARAVLAPPPSDRGEIRFGARVTLRSAGGHGAAIVRAIQIVGVDEADPAVGLIAFVAPLARALLGHRAGDTVTVRSPGGVEELTVTAVAYDDA